MKKEEMWLQLGWVKMEIDEKVSELESMSIRLSEVMDTLNSMIVDEEDCKNKFK